MNEQKVCLVQQMLRTYVRNRKSGADCLLFLEQRNSIVLPFHISVKRQCCHILTTKYLRLIVNEAGGGGGMK